MVLNVDLKVKVSKAGKRYVALVADVGYRDVIIALDNATISELLSVSIGDIVATKERLLAENK